MVKVTEKELKYYSEQSIITDPKEHIDLYQGLPSTVEELMKVVNGIIIHGAQNELYDLNFSSKQTKEELLRTVSQMLGEIRKNDSRVLVYKREPAKRLVGMCRDMSVLLTSFLRYKNIPARVRSGFSSYFNSDIKNEDHWLVEYWDKQTEQWKLADPQLDDIHIDKYGITFDITDVKYENGYLTGGQVLKKCNANEVKKDDFGFNKYWKGLKSIRGNMLHDFNCLNKIELMPWDLWTKLIRKKESNTTKEDLATFDMIADMTTNVSANFDSLKEVYDNLPYEYCNEIESQLRILGIMGNMKVVNPNQLEEVDIFKEYRLKQDEGPENVLSQVETSHSKAIPDKEGYIVVNGARQNNLKNISVEIPKNQFVVITGVSGSGKSSLAFDVVYAEGRRRYMEGFSNYLRSQMGMLEKPDVDHIIGLTPPIAIEQKTVVKNPRSTVGSMTDLIDCFRVLYSKIGTFHCPQCGKSVRETNSAQILKMILSMRPSTNVKLFAPVGQFKKIKVDNAIRKAKEEGFEKIRVDGNLISIKEASSIKSTESEKIDLLSLDMPLPDKNASNYKEASNQLLRMIERTMKLGRSIIKVRIADTKEVSLSSKNMCADCNLFFPKNTPTMFDYNSHQGACHECNGLGICLEVDETMIITDPTLSILDGASNYYGVLRNKKRTGNWMIGELFAMAERFEEDLDKPWNELSEKFKHAALYGTGDIEYSFEYISNGRNTQIMRPAYGAITNINRLFRETKSESSRSSYLQFMKESKCPVCKGEKLAIEARYVKIWDERLPQITTMPIDELAEWVNELQNHLTSVQLEIAGEIIDEIKKRLTFLIDVGLHYLKLERPAPSLSGGEGQRIRLATQLGSSLVGLLYVLDEPSIGLHPKDHESLLYTIKKLKEDGNSVIVVEHDSDTMMAADWIIDIGPGAGALGGNVVGIGTPKDIIDNPNSITGQYLKGTLRVTPLNKQRKKAEHFLEIKGATLNNLQNVTARIPLGVMTCVTGVSGSGKSSLITKTLSPALENILSNGKFINENYEEITGYERLDNIIHINQEPIGRSPRSTPATYVGLFEEIRKFYTNLPQSKIRNYIMNYFSFNSKNGQCVSCEGYGEKKIEMHFMPDTWVTCTECEGKRFNPEVLEVTYKDKTIADILNMDTLKALEFFEDVPAIHNILQTLNDVGLYYLKLGQNSTTLSGGEAQRIKLAKELQKTGTGSTIYILDEPTTGLHFSDITKLLKVLDRLSAAGNTVILIEHNTEVISSADWVIDLGPGGGNEGGKIIAKGTPEEVANNSESPTGRFIKSYLQL